MREHQDHFRDALKAMDASEVISLLLTYYRYYTLCFILFVMLKVFGYSHLHMIPSFDIIQLHSSYYMQCVSWCSLSLCKYINISSLITQLFLAYN